jgi:hypothetical protein
MHEAIPMRGLTGAMSHPSIVFFPSMALAIAHAVQLGFTDERKRFRPSLWRFP